MTRASTAGSRFSSFRTRSRWRVVDIIVASVLAVACGVIFFAWDQVWGGLDKPLSLLVPGLGSVLGGVWLLAGVLVGLVIRRPGAALYGEIVAASVETLLGSQWGPLTLLQGLIQGVGAELVFAIFLYGVWRMPVAMLAGAVSGLALAINDLTSYYPGSAPTFATVYTVGSVLSGAVLAGTVSWLLVRALASTGVLSRFSSGRQARV